MDMRWIRLVALLVFAIAPLGWMPSAAADRGTIAAWAQNSRSAVEAFGITQLRTGCNGTAEECTDRARDVLRAEGVPHAAITFAVLRSDSATLREKAAAYGTLSLSNPEIVEIGMDDFYSFIRRNKMDDFETVIGAAKSTNPRIRVGVTLYEDELDRIAPDQTLFPAAMRQAIDRIYLYLHYRQNGPDFARYVDQVRELFPNAEIFGGVYAYDRIDYIPCAQGGGSARCDRQREIDLFRQALEVQVALMRSGRLAGLEFYPGQFGREDQWGGWSKPKICQPTRVEDCIEVTREMRRIARRVLDGS